MNNQQAPSPGRSPVSSIFPTLVLVEDDDDMWFATVPFPEPPAEGAIFQFRGQVWQVVWVDTPGCRAEPVLM